MRLSILGRIRDGAKGGLASLAGVRRRCLPVRAARLDRWFLRHRESRDKFALLGGAGSYRTRISDFYMVHRRV